MTTYMNRVYDRNIAFLSATYNYLATSKSVSGSCACVCVLYLKNNNDNSIYACRKALAITDPVLIYRSSVI